MEASPVVPVRKGRSNVVFGLATFLRPNSGRRRTGEKTGDEICEGQWVWARQLRTERLEILRIQTGDARESRA